jgi:cell wall-associated NlpC family hydrolase
VGFRLSAAVVLLALVHAGGVHAGGIHAGNAAAASNPTSRSWAAPEIKAVTAAGLMQATSVATFRANDVLTAQTLEDLVFGLKQAVFPPAPVDEAIVDPVAVDPVGVNPTLPVDPATTTTTTTTTTAAPAAPKQVASPARPVTMAALDARLVQALGLTPAAQAFTKGAKAAGLKVPSRFGTEVVARLLGLRTNHPASEDSLELLPTDPATRAEAAYSAAQILRFSDWQIAGVQSLADGFELPAFSDWQTRILDTAVARIGMPYIWGGESDGPASPFGVSSRGGYDCSGFVWRVYKTELYPGAGLLPAVLRGRTTYQMSGEVPASQRIGVQKLEPADVVFFGAKGPRSQPSQVDHMGIYVGNGWFVHSSGYGVALARLDGWYQRSFAWARRPLREAGLAG